MVVTEHIDNKLYEHVPLISSMVSEIISTWPNTNMLTSQQDAQQDTGRHMPLLPLSSAFSL